MFRKLLSKLQRTKVDRIIKKATKIFNKYMAYYEKGWEIEIQSITLSNDYSAVTAKYYIEPYVNIKGCFSYDYDEDCSKFYYFNHTWDTSVYSLKETVLMLIQSLLLKEEYADTKLSTEKDSGTK